MKACTEIALILLVNLLCSALVWKIGYEVGFDAAMDSHPACVQEAR